VAAAVQSNRPATIPPTMIFMQIPSVRDVILGRW
jgi:hypothetical protein